MLTFSFSMAWQLLMGHCLIIGASHSHSDIPQSVGLLWTGDRPVAETSTWQHTTLATDNYAPWGIRTYNPSKRAAADPRLRSHGPRFIVTSYNFTIIALIFKDGAQPVTVQMSVGPSRLRRVTSKEGDHNQLLLSKDSDILIALGRPLSRQDVFRSVQYIFNL